MDRLSQTIGAEISNYKLYKFTFLPHTATRHDQLLWWPRTRKRSLYPYTSLPWPWLSEKARQKVTYYSRCNRTETWRPDGCLPSVAFPAENSKTQSIYVESETRRERRWCSHEFCGAHKISTLRLQNDPVTRPQAKVGSSALLPFNSIHTPKESCRYFDLASDSLKKIPK